MGYDYISVPLFTTLNEIIKKGYTLSATQYKSFNIPNKNAKPLSRFLDRELKRSDLGNEVGSDCYVEESGYSFIKTKALQPESFLLDVTKESVQCVTPQSYIPMTLKKGDILISKDSNVGEIVILDKDYQNHMLCGGLYRLPVTKLKYYLLAMIKSDVFRQQIDFLVPRGSTIRHGKTKFLDCLIPLPNKNSNETICFVELLMRAIINKEIAIKQRHSQILDEIQTELVGNQCKKGFVYELPKISEIMALDRMDSALYSEEFKKKEFLITNYKNGYQSLTEKGYRGIRGTSLENNFIKNRIDSDVFVEGFYKLIIPTNITRYGTVAKTTFIGTSTKLKTIKQKDIIFGGEGYGKGKSFVVIEKEDNIATNYHGIRITNKKEETLTSIIFVKCMLTYLREHGLIDSYGVGGNGGHFAPAYFYLAKIPNFPNEKQSEIAKLYYNPMAKYDASACNLDSFIEYDNLFNETAGIYDLDKSMKQLKALLDDAIRNIVEDREVAIQFSLATSTKNED